MLQLVDPKSDGLARPNPIFYGLNRLGQKGQSAFKLAIFRPNLV